MNESARRFVWLMGVLGAMLLAAYAGFRLPSQYSMTIYNVTLGDSAWRRGILGTLSAPIINVSGNRYGAMALIAFVALALLLTSMIVVALRSRWRSQTVLLIVWLISPAG